MEAPYCPTFTFLRILSLGVYVLFMAQDLFRGTHPPHICFHINARNRHCYKLYHIMFFCVTFIGAHLHNRASSSVDTPLPLWLEPSLSLHIPITSRWRTAATDGIMVTGPSVCHRSRSFHIACRQTRFYTPLISFLGRFDALSFTSWWSLHSYGVFFS